MTLIERMREDAPVTIPVRSITLEFLEARMFRGVAYILIVV